MEAELSADRNVVPGFAQDPGLLVARRPGNHAEVVPKSDFHRIHLVTQEVVDGIADDVAGIDRADLVDQQPSRKTVDSLSGYP